MSTLVFLFFWGFFLFFFFVVVAVFCFFPLETGVLCVVLETVLEPGCPQGDLPVSASQLLVLKVCATTAWLEVDFFIVAQTH